MTGIEWTQRVWNATTGCDRVSPGCDHCYALTMAKRLKGMGQAKYQRDGDPKTSGPGFGLTIHEDALTLPLRWRKPSTVFVNSMSDLFHADVPISFLADVFAVMAASPQHVFQVLTKRHARMRSLLREPGFRGLVEELRLVHTHTRDGFVWPLPNVHLGVSAEDQHWADIRIPALLETPAAVRWISAEPLLGPLNLRTGRYAMPPEGEVLGTSLEGIDWLVVGGESGPGARPMHIEWARRIVGQCQAAGVPVFVKQLGSVWGRANGADPKGGKPEFWPEDLRVREYPQPAEVRHAS